MKIGSVPSSWLAITETWDAELLLALLRRVNDAGIAHDDRIGVTAIWQSMRAEAKE